MSVGEIVINEEYILNAEDSGGVLLEESHGFVRVECGEIWDFLSVLHAPKFWKCEFVMGNCGFETNCVTYSEVFSSCGVVANIVTHFMFGVGVVVGTLGSFWVATHMLECYLVAVREEACVEYALFRAFTW